MSMPLPFAMRDADFQPLGRPIRCKPKAITFSPPSDPFETEPHEIHARTGAPVSAGVDWAPVALGAQDSLAAMMDRAVANLRLEKLLSQEYPMVGEQDCLAAMDNLIAIANTDRASVTPECNALIAMLDSYVDAKYSTDQEIAVRQRPAAALGAQDSLEATLTRLAALHDEAQRYFESTLRAF